MRSGVPTSGVGPYPASKDLAARMAALAELDVARLRAEWRRLYRSHPPKRITHDLLRLAIAWKLQERAYGGLPAATKRKLASLTRTLSEKGSLDRSRSARLKPGAKLVREWRGETHTVLVVDDGFEWRHARYGSLSQIARQITGTRWSGPRFFGLGRKAAPAVTGDAGNG